MSLTTRSSDRSDEPRAAATLVLLREGPRGPEVLLTKRPRSMRFMGGATVFPGGAVSAADRDPGWEDLSRLSEADARARLGADAPALGWFVCALREAFEEVGYLAADGPVRALDRADAGDPARFLIDCREAGVVLCTDALVPAGRWVTPLGSPIRFDTRFFVTEVGEDFEPVPDPDEVDGCWWSTPAEALDALGEGSLTMAPPTVEMLQRLAAFGTVAEALGGLTPDSVVAGSVLAARLSPLVRAVLAPNPGVMTGPGTNSYVVGAGSVAVIDPAVDDNDYLDALVGDDEIGAILVTHRHPDHVGGIEALVRRTGAPVRAFGAEPAGGIEVVPLADGEVITAGPAELRALHTPGHASDHLCFELIGAATLFSGDNIMGEGTAVIAPPDGNMSDYMNSLERLAGLEVDRIYPAHFKPLDGGAAVIRAYIEHRRDRERKVLVAVTGGAETLDEVVAVVYTDVAPALHPIAAYSAAAHLEMLEADGKLKRTDGKWSPV